LAEIEGRKHVLELHHLDSQYPHFGADLSMEEDEREGVTEFDKKSGLTDFADMSSLRSHSGARKEGMADRFSKE